MIDKNKTVYGLLALLTLALSMIIYFLFRDLSNIILFSWIQKPEIFENILFPLKTSIFNDYLRFNIPDALWLVSAILLLRFIWFDKIKIQTVYVNCFYIIGFAFEISQILDKVPGTFDWLDLLFMGIGVFVENLLYKKFILRRCL